MISTLAFFQGLDELQEVLQEANSVFPPWILYTLIALTVSVVTLLLAMKIYKDNKAQIHAEFAYRRVAKQFGLNRKQRNWLTAVARKNQLCSPLVLLMSAETLRFYLKEYIAGLSRQRQQTEIERGNHILQKVYDE